MGLFKRLHRITIGRIEAFLDRAEDPEIMLPELLREMEKQLVAGADAEAKARAAMKSAQRDHDTHREKIARLERGATRALQAGDEQVARMAIEVQLDSERFLNAAEENLDRAQDSLDHAVAARKHIQQQLAELRARKSEILTRSRVARAQQKIQRTVAGTIGSSGSILDSVARLEAGVEEIEAKLEIQASMAGVSGVQPSLYRRLQQLDVSAEVESRLATLRRNIAVGESAING